jgi:iron only hydrogenase large subunit-like protein
MAVAGTLTKIGLDDCEKTPSGSTNSYFHVAIMPCHDKKLEAGRADFAWEKQVLLQYGNSSKIDHELKTSLLAENDLVNEVDLVITTGELLEALSDAITTQKKREVSVLTILPTINSEADHTSKSDTIRKYLSQVNDGLDLLGVLKNVTNSNYQQEDNETMSSLELDTGVHGSGSYADFIFRWAARELFDCELSSNTPLPWKSSSSTHTTSTTGQGSGLIRRRSRRQETTDMREVTLFEHNDGSYSCFDSASEDNVRTSQPVLHFATAYGFKNVQLILQSLSKTESSSLSSRGYDYVEIMACPSGCSNGGGQIGGNGHRETPRETKLRVNKTVSVMPMGRPLQGGCTTISDALIDCDIKGLVKDDAFLQDVECFNERAKQLFHTRFHVVPALELSTGATAGVALSDTKW